MLDFLYSDHERVASLLSQLSSSGSLSSVEQGGSKSKTSKRQGEVGLGLIKGGTGSERDWNREVRETYDPLWLNSARFIERVSDRTDGNEILDYGKLVTKRGKLICLDQALFNNLLKSPAIIDQMAQGIEPEEGRSSKVQNKQKRELADIVREFVQSLPLGVVFVLFSDKEAFWFNVKREYLQIQSLDIPLKFPVQIGGIWQVTGIIDALPGDYVNFSEELEEFGERIVLSQAFSIITQIIVPIVGLFGRPAGTYGLSPLTIHRDIVL